jgi:DNA-binding response OmpR family regulator
VTPPQAPSVLIVDDDEPTSRVIRLSLEMEGYSAIPAFSREDALAQIENRAPDLVIMDYVMGGMPADVFVSKARAVGFTGKIILCTGLDHEFSLPVDEVLKKPFDPQALVERVNSLLAGGSTGSV